MLNRRPILILAATYDQFFDYVLRNISAFCKLLDIEPGTPPATRMNIKMFCATQGIIFVKDVKTMRGIMDCYYITVGTFVLDRADWHEIMIHIQTGMRYARELELTKEGFK